ncbi:tRNA (5-methylaminomethyl-2-thiouridine)(34)-methyltransferase MnmD [Flavobacterium nackdongense]|uniref:SAM-dependent methyltransferase n=1 Tax=Flavobacterium nackdongense TaxID=2547394 RepID=A0A4V1AGG1_9FLAO|nr:tRNA (5-methylaminomethyl-2-thiouridine)(34)-methyltransferase MnmD [Flavobacterium nackdongense]QBN17922.1 SAM-dependent methyltransferase [Flavobacterium nackdongense]
MKRNIVQTRDGSTTIHIEDWDECYHSRFGAIQEAQHVFIKKGLSLFENQSVSILEIGFGTGLNAFITFLEYPKFKQKITYVGVEGYPVTVEEAQAMNYVSELNAETERPIFEKLHHSSWNEPHVLQEDFVFTKRQQFFTDINDSASFDLIYFDAFGYDVQPELWTAEIFNIMYKALKNKGVLVTYAARGVIKRNMIEAGFTVEKLEGAPGKREMFRAIKEIME